MRDSAQPLMVIQAFMRMSGIEPTYELTHFSLLKAIERAFRPASALAEHMGINHRRRNVIVPQQFLDRPDVRPALEQVGCVRVTKGMTADVLVNANQRHRSLDRSVQGRLIQMMAPLGTGPRVDRQVPRRELILPAPLTPRIRILAVQGTG